MSTESSQIKKVRQFEDKCQIIAIDCRRNRNHSYLSFLINPVLWNLRRKLQFERQWKIINFSVILIALLKAKEENCSFSNKTCFIWTFISSNFFFSGEMCNCEERLTSAMTECFKNRFCKTILQCIHLLTRQYTKGQNVECFSTTFNLRKHELWKRNFFDFLSNDWTISDSNNT